MPATNRFIAKWEAQAARGELVNVTDDMSELTLEIVLQSIFGTDLERLAQEMGGNPFDIVTKEPARDLKFAYRFRQLAKLVAALVARRRAEKTEHFDFLGMLMDARDKETGAPMSERELIDEVMTLDRRRPRNHRQRPQLDLVPAVAEPARPRRCCTRRSTRNPEKPTPSLVGNGILLATPRTLSTKRCACIRRAGCCRAARSGRTRSSGYAVPAGTDVLLCLYLLHRHPRYWKEPDAFRPERFDAAHEAERPRFAYMPFAAGPGIASARHWPYMKCTCTYIRWRAATG